MSDSSLTSQHQPSFRAEQLGTFGTTPSPPKCDRNHRRIPTSLTSQACPFGCSVCHHVCWKSVWHGDVCDVVTWCICQSSWLGRKMSGKRLYHTLSSDSSASCRILQLGHVWDEFFSLFCSSESRPHLPGCTWLNTESQITRLCWVPVRVAIYQLDFHS